MPEYLNRTVDAELRTALETTGAIVVQGARAVGKTETARQFARSELRLDSADARAVLAREQPITALEGNTPRLLDEWQLVPALWNEVRRAVDDRRSPGQFILSGSAVPDDDAIRHSGAGRFQRLMMRTLSLQESGESTAEVSLAQLLAGRDPALAESDVDFAQLVSRLVVGGWPGWLGASEASAGARARAYLDDLAEHDFVHVAGTRRDPRRFLSYARGLAGLIAQPASYAAIARRSEQASAELAPAAISELHDLAARVFLIEDQPAWSPKLRSRQALVQTPKRHLVDVSLAAALLGATSDRLLAEPETLGFLFESQVVHDLRVYAQAIGARGVFHLRDTKGRDEIDAVVEGADGSWLGVEAKLGLGSVDTAAATLRRVAAKVERPPAGLVVVIPVGVAHRRADGVCVVPLTVLGP